METIGTLYMVIKKGQGGPALENGEAVAVYTL